MKFKRGGYITAVEASQLLDGVDQQVEKEMSGVSAGSLVEWFNTRIASGGGVFYFSIVNKKWEGTIFEAEERGGTLTNRIEATWVVSRGSIKEAANSRISAATLMRKKNKEG